MPFLRFAIYEQLLKAENLLADRREHPGRRIGDLDLDGRPEVKLHNPALNCYLKPDRGGALYELDDRERGWNLTAVMTRRPEATHRRLVEAVQSGKAFVVQPGGRAQSIHDLVRCKEPGLEKLLQYDSYVRESLLDHFYPADAAVAALQRSEVAEWGDFIGAEYDLKAPPSRGSAVTLSRSGRAGPPGRQAPVQISKRVTLGKGGTLEARYALGFPGRRAAGHRLRRRVQLRPDGRECAGPELFLPRAREPRQPEHADLAPPTSRRWAWWTSGSKSPSGCTPSRTPRSGRTRSRP